MHRAGPRAAAAPAGSAGSGFLDEVGEVVTSDDDHFSEPAAAITHVVPTGFVVGARVRPGRVVAVRAADDGVSAAGGGGVAGAHPGGLVDVDLARTRRPPRRGVPVSATVGR